MQQRSFKQLLQKRSRRYVPSIRSTTRTQRDRSSVWNPRSKARVYGQVARCRSDQGTRSALEQARGETQGAFAW